MKYNFVFNHLKLDTMKRKNPMIIIILLFILVIGCKEVIIDPTPITPIKYQVELTTSGENAGGFVSQKGTNTLEKNTIFSFTVKDSLGYTSVVKNNGVIMTPSSKDSIIVVLNGIAGITKEKIRAVNGYSYLYEIPVLKDTQIDVSFAKNQKFYLTRSPWKKIFEKRKTLEATDWMETVYPPDIQFFIMTFDEEYVRMFKSNGEKIGDMHYSISADGKTIKLGDGIEGNNIRLDNSNFTYDFVYVYIASFGPPLVLDHTKDILAQCGFSH